MNANNQESQMIGDFSSQIELQNWMKSKLEQAASVREAASGSVAVSAVIARLAGVDPQKLGQLNMRTLDILEFKGYTLHKILFQSQHGVDISANLYVPEGIGPFPAILNSHGHWEGGKGGAIVQQTANLLVSAGYVVLCIDAWGSGERGTGNNHEYHGGHLAGALLQASETLLGLQLLDNLQSINLLCALDFVDSARIGAVGASGGGNQTMWISAFDQRIRAAALVVSVGTFSGYLLQSNCMCELLPAGLQQIEACDVIGAIAPRAVKIISAAEEQIAAFKVDRMRKAYRDAVPHFNDLDVAEKISFEIFESAHDFTIEMQQSVLRFFKQTIPAEQAITEHEFTPLEVDKLRVGGSNQGPTRLMTTRDLFKQRENEAVVKLNLRNEISKSERRKALKNLLKTNEGIRVESSHPLTIDSSWQTGRLKTNDGQTIPLRYNLSASAKEKITISLTMDAAERSDHLTDTIYVDLLGVGERGIDTIDRQDIGLPQFHTLTRSFMWLGESLMGRWVSELRAVVVFVRKNFQPGQITIIGHRDLALVALFYGSLYSDVQRLELNAVVLSHYLPMDLDCTQSQSMAIHVPGILEWGTLVLVGALADIPVDYIAPVDIGGGKMDDTAIKTFNRQIQVLRKRIVK